MNMRGLTLLEVMVALAIFAITGTAVLKAASDHLLGVGQIEEITFATWVANNRASELHMAKSWPVQDSQKGNQQMAGRTWYWQQRVSKTADEDLRAVEIAVSLDEDNSNPVTSIVTYVAKPES